MPFFVFDIVLASYFIMYCGLAIVSVIAFMLNSKTLDNLNYILVFLVTLCFFGLRSDGSPDTKMYLEQFISLRGYADFEWSYSFYWLMKSIKIFTDEPSSYILLSSLFLLLFLSFSIYLWVPESYRSICLIYFSLSWSFFDLATNTYRQGLACIFLLIFAHFFNKKYYLYSFIFIFIAIGFHWSVPIVMLLIMFSCKISKYDKAINLLLFFCIVYGSVSLFYSNGMSVIFGSIESVFDGFSLITGFNLTMKKQAYLNAGVDGVEFYLFPIQKRLYFVLEIVFSLCVLTVLKLKVKNYNADRLNLVITSYLIMVIYFFMLIDMTWFFRNMYWAICFIPILMANAQAVFLEKRNGYVELSFPIFMVFSYFIVSVYTLWRSEILRLNYFG